MCILRLLSRLNGLPNSIVRLHEVYESNTHIHMVLPRCSSVYFSVFDLMVDSGRINEIKAKKILLDILNALVFLHHNGLVHRDLKPEHIIFNYNNKTAMITGNYNTNTNLKY